MDKTKSSSVAEKTTQSKHTNAQMIQNTLLIWLDGNIDTKNDEYGGAISQFRRVINTVKTFTNGDECIQFIEGLNNEIAYMVISGSLGQHTVPRIHDLSQIDSIFIFCSNKNHHEKWAKDWTKIKGVYTEIAPICKTLKQFIEHSEQSTVSMGSIKTNDCSDVFFGNFNQLDSSFMYTQILKEILLSIQFERKHIQKFIDFCREQFVGNDVELKKIEMFEREYHNKKPIWWYNYLFFLSPMINRALQTMDMDILIKAGFFICDLHRQIEQLHSEQFSGHHSDKTFTVYRGQSLSKADFEQMSKRQGGLISFNIFLTTSIDRQVSLDVARHATTKSDLVGILFAMTIDTSKPTVPFASIANVDYCHQEGEVLFSTHTVFRIVEIKPIDEKHRTLFQIDLTLTNETDDDLGILTDHLRVEISQHSNSWYQLGLLLFKMNQMTSAQHIYEVLLKETSNEGEQEQLFHQLGLIKDNQGENNEAIIYFKKALAIGEKIRSPKDSHLASSFNNIGSMYEKTKDYLKALESYEKALAIYQQTRPPNHPDLVTTYNNIGSTHNHLGNYPKALSFYSKALEIQERTLPSNHPDLASSYDNIGLMHGKLNEFSKAVSFFERAVSIAENSLSPNHPTLKTYKAHLDAAKKKL
jgi:Tfp pilus assembly protein PilF